MNITTIKYMKRKNLGNYEHEEVSFEAVLAEGEDAGLAVIQLKELAHAALEGDIVSVGKTADNIAALKVEAPTTVKEEKKAAPRAAKAKAAPVVEAKKDTLENGQEIPPVIPNQEAAPSENTGTTSTVAGSTDTKNESAVQSEAPKASASVVGKGVVAYDATVKEHRSRFATYLGATFPKWTPDAQFGKLKEGEKPTAERTAYSEKIQVFSKGLHGKAFEDAKGNMLESFKAELEAFFSYAK